MPLDVEEVALRSATSAEWAAAPASGLVLQAGELGLDLTTGEIRKGNGTDVWSALSTAGPRRGVATLVAGAKVVSDPLVTANSRILLTVQSLGTVTAPKAIGVTARTPGTSFTITSADNTDTSIVAYEIVEQ